MPSHVNRPGLAAFDRALAAGEIEAARAALFALTPEEREILAAQLGDEGLARLYESARRARRGPTQGRPPLGRVARAVTESPPLEVT